MNTICPICGKDNTATFFDTVTGEHGFHCEDCHKDFGVDDGKKYESYIKNLCDFHYEVHEEDGTKKIIDIHSTGKEVLLNITLKKAKEESYLKADPIDFSSDFEGFKSMLWEKIFFLDWPSSIPDKTEDSQREVLIECRFRMGLIPTVKKEYQGAFPPYLTVLDYLFASLFTNLKEVNNE